MKPYFTKYIPVEEEIEDDNFFLTPDGRISQCKQVLESMPATIMNYNGETWKEDELKKVKLFLCSRDMQVGDRLTDTYGKNEYIYEGFDEKGNYFVTNTTFPYGNCSKQYFDDCFLKLIGEISPEATWVKEGDEFDDSQIAYWYSGTVKPTSFNEMTKEEKRLAIKRFIKRFEEPSIIGPFIKGPCGHFH